MEADSLRVGFCVDGPRIDSSSEIYFFLKVGKDRGLSSSRIRSFRHNFKHTKKYTYLPTLISIS